MATQITSEICLEKMTETLLILILHSYGVKEPENIVLRSGERLIFAELLVLRSSDSGHVCWTTVEEDIVVVALTTSHDFH